jgi:monofunctional biosynthetic peptidoglycan transglycosylase
MSKARRRGRLRTLLRFALWALLLCWLGSVLLVGVLRFVPPPTSAFMIARSIEARRAGDNDFRIRQQWRGFDDIAATLPLAVIASEDQRFLEHHGFDLVEIRNAMDDEDGPRRGASTISQQVAKNLFLWSGRSYVRKGLEVWFTMLIEAMWSKRRIVEVYLNIAEFGDGVYGVDAAARRYFGVGADRIGSAQAARMAAVLPNPKRYRLDKPGPYVLQRQRWIERQMQQLGGTALIEPLRNKK